MFDEDEVKGLVLGIGIGILAIMLIWAFEGADRVAFGGIWNEVGLFALAIGLIAFGTWWSID